MGVEVKTREILLVIFVTAGICSAIGYGYGKRSVQKSLSITDTIRLRDTIRDSIPYPIVETIIQEVPELFPVYITMEGDTIHEPVYVPVPISQKEYQTEDYHAWVGLSPYVGVGGYWKVW